MICQEDLERGQAHFPNPANFHPLIGIRDQFQFLHSPIIFNRSSSGWTLIVKVRDKMRASYS